MAFPLPRNVIAKRLANGKLGFYFNVQSIYRKLGCPTPWVTIIRLHVAQTATAVGRLR